jgi:hypothetical protein
MPGVRWLPNLSVTPDKNSMPLFFIIVFTFFVVLPVLLVWRLHRVPIKGDIQMQLIWRGAVAGITGGAIGATSSSLIFGTGAYAPIGYLHWLLMTAILGMVFTLIIGAIQKSRLSLNLLGRAAIGAIIGIATAWGWASAIRADFAGPIDWFSKGIVSMIIGSGIVSGILGGPLNKEA